MAVPLLFLLISLPLMNVSNITFSFVKSVLETKTITDVTSTSMTLSNHYSVSAESSGFTDGSLFSLSKDGYIRNTEPIRGIESITLTYGAGSGYAKIVPCYYDYENDAVVPTEETWPDASTSGDFSSSPIDYFEIFNANSSAITITSISIDYGCSTATYSFDVSFTPDWNGSTAEDPADIYIAGTSELINDGTSAGSWKWKKMTFSAGTYSYSSTVSTGKYVYALYASKNGQAINWSNKASESDITVVIDDDYTDNTSYSWDKEPGSATTYTLNINYYETASGAWTQDWIGFTYSTSNSGISSGDWGANLTWISKTDGVDLYQYNGFEVESAGTIIYLSLKGKVISSSDEQDNVYIGASTTNAIQINFINGATTADVNVYMTMTTVASTYAATSYDYELSGGVVVSGMSHSNVSMSIYDLDSDDTSITNGKRLINPSFDSGSDTFTPSYSGSNIRIDEIDGNYYITALKAGTVTSVTLTCDNNPSVTCSFNVTVPSSTYTATSARDSMWASDEGWFNSTSVGEIAGMGSSFMNGIDISSCKALYQNGTNFYNASGVEQSLFYILKDAGINWIRLKIWVDPQSSDGTVNYGGGESNLANTLWMAYEAKQAGLNLLLDFHYSDYWTHPGQQILPKSWNDCDTKAKLCERIEEYTTETLTAFKNNDCLPDMVQLGNEISSGIYLQKYSGASDTLNAYGEPGYLTGKSNYSYGTKNSAEFTDYIKAASDGVDAVDSSIKKVLHWAKGSTINASVINSFFSNMPSSYYDYAAISYYPFYCFNTMSEASTILSELSLSKPWFIAETSYPFTGASYVTDYINGVYYERTNFTISNWNTGDTTINNVYSFTPSGQANLIHDLTAATVSAGGLGIFYWEGAWVPNNNVNWAGEGSKNSWGNQGFFSYDGKAIANLNLFAQMSQYI